MVISTTEAQSHREEGKGGGKESGEFARLRRGRPRKGGWYQQRDQMIYMAWLDGVSRGKIAERWLLAEEYVWEIIRREAKHPQSPTGSRSAGGA